MFKWFQSCWCLIFISDCWLIPPLWVIQLWVSLLAFPATNWPSWDSERLLDPPINPISEHVSLPPGLLRSGPGWVRTCHLFGWQRHEPHAGSMGQKNEPLCLCVTFFWVFIFVKHIKANVSSYNHDYGKADRHKIRQRIKTRAIFDIFF